MSSRKPSIHERFGQRCCVYCWKDHGQVVPAPYRVAKEGSHRRIIESRAGLYCAEHAEYQLGLYIKNLPIKEHVRWATGQQTDEDVLLRLADDIKDFAVRRLQDAGRGKEAEYLAGTPIRSNRAYKRVSGRAWYVGPTRRIEFALKYFKDTKNVADAFRQTILHEICHIVSYAKNGYKGFGHGDNWKAECAFFEIKASRFFIGCGFIAICGAPVKDPEHERVANQQAEELVNL